MDFDIALMCMAGAAIGQVVIFSGIAVWGICRITKAIKNHKGYAVYAPEK